MSRSFGSILPYRPSLGILLLFAIFANGMLATSAGTLTTKKSPYTSISAPTASSTGSFLRGPPVKNSTSSPLRCSNLRWSTSTSANNTQSTALGLYGAGASQSSGVGSTDIAEYCGLSSSVTTSGPLETAHVSANSTAKITSTQYTGMTGGSRTSDISGQSNSKTLKIGNVNISSTTSTISIQDINVTGGSRINDISGQSNSRTLKIGDVNISSTANTTSTQDTNVTGRSRTNDTSGHSYSTPSPRKTKISHSGAGSLGTSEGPTNSAILPGVIRSSNSQASSTGSGSSSNSNYNTASSRISGVTSSPANSNVKTTPGPTYLPDDLSSCSSPIYSSGTAFMCGPNYLASTVLKYNEFSYFKPKGTSSTTAAPFGWYIAQPGDHNDQDHAVVFPIIWGMVFPKFPQISGLIAIIFPSGFKLPTVKMPSCFLFLLGACPRNKIPVPIQVPSKLLPDPNIPLPPISYPPPPEDLPPDYDQEAKKEEEEEEEEENESTSTDENMSQSQDRSKTSESKEPETTNPEQSTRTPQTSDFFTSSQTIKVSASSVSSSKTSQSSFALSSGTTSQISSSLSSRSSSSLSSRNFSSFSSRSFSSLSSQSFSSLSSQTASTLTSTTSAGSCSWPSTEPSPGSSATIMNATACALIPPGVNPQYASMSLSVPQLSGSVFSVSTFSFSALTMPTAVLGCSQTPFQFVPIPRESIAVNSAPTLAAATSSPTATEIISSHLSTAVKFPPTSTTVKPQPQPPSSSVQTQPSATLIGQNDDTWVNGLDWNNEGSSLCSAITEQTCQIAINMYKAGVMYWKYSSHYQEQHDLGDYSSCLAKFQCSSDAAYGIGYDGAQLIIFFDFLLNRPQVDPCGSQQIPLPPKTKKTKREIEEWLQEHGNVTRVLQPTGRDRFRRSHERAEVASDQTHALERRDDTCYVTLDMCHDCTTTAPCYEFSQPTDCYGPRPSNWPLRTCKLQNFYGGGRVPQVVSRQCNCNDGTHPPPYEDQQSMEWKCVDETPGSDNNARAKRKRKRELQDRRERRREGFGKDGNGGGVEFRSENIDYSINVGST